MVLVNFLGQQFQIVIGAGTTSGGLSLRRAPAWAGVSSAEELVAAMSDAQIDALTTMASWAETNLAGVTGTTSMNGRTVPESAARMAEQFGGQSFGGRSAQQQRDRQKAGRINVGDIEAEARRAGQTPGGG